MPVLNSDIARSLDKLANLLELEGANPFRIRAYRNAARVVGEWPRSVIAMTAAGKDLAELPGIGEDLAQKIETVAATGHIAVLDEIERRTPAGLLALLDVPGLGPKRARLQREGYDIDLERILMAARERGCALEVNGQPDRLDLDERHCKLAKEIGVKLVLSTDAHSPNELGFMRYSVEQARRGWLEPADILNTRGLDELRAAFRRS
jgi:histidinol phosphatase-like PHP family hydrolase